MLVDSARARSGERHVTWRLDGSDAFRDVSTCGGAALLLTAHMGNYDVAGPFFADKFGRTVHGVRRPERRAELQEYMEARRQAQASGAYRVQYNTEGGFLGVELAQALAAGEVVAIQGDRVGEGMGSVEVEWRGRLWRLPSGPLVLAQVASAPVFPVFMLRDGWRSYRILFLPARPPAPPPATRADRAAAQQEHAAWWANTLAGVLERHWPLWLMFEPAFGSLPAPGEAPLVRPRVEPSVPPPAATARPERTTAAGWRPTLQPISRTYLGRFLNTRGLLLPREAPHQLSAEDSAQNWIEVVVLAAFNAALTAAAAWLALVALFPKTWAAFLLAPTWFVLLHLAPLACGLIADACKRLPGVPARWSVTRLAEEWIFFTQTLLSLWLLATPLRWLGAAWLGFALANALSFVQLAWARRRGPGEQ
jgi:lauroyl/myristoyl acyltransferase